MWHKNTQVVNFRYLTIWLIAHFMDELCHQVTFTLDRLTGNLHSPFISFKNAVIQAIAMTHEQDN